MRVEDGLGAVAVVQVGPHERIDLELEVVRGRGGVAAGHVFHGDVVLEHDEAARLVRQLGVRVGHDLRANRGGDHHQIVRSMDSATSVSEASQKSAETYFQPASVRIVTITPSSSSCAIFRATCTAAPEETPAKMPSS